MSDDLKQALAERVRSLAPQSLLMLGSDRMGLVDLADLTATVPRIEVVELETLLRHWSSEDRYDGRHGLADNRPLGFRMVGDLHGMAGGVGERCSQSASSESRSRWAARCSKSVNPIRSLSPPACREARHGTAACSRQRGNRQTPSARHRIFKTPFSFKSEDW